MLRNVHLPLPVTCYMSSKWVEGLLSTGLTALSLLAEAPTNNRPFQTVEPEKLTKKFYKNNVCLLLGDGACI